MEWYDEAPLFVTERMDSYRYSESAGPWWLDRQRNRKITCTLPFFKSMTSVEDLKSTSVRAKEFWGSLSVQLLHKEWRIVPVVAPWTSSRKSRAFLFPVMERLTDFVRGIRMESHGRSTPIERGRISISSTTLVSRRCSRRFPSVGTGLDIVMEKSTLYLESARSASLMELTHSGWITGRELDGKLG